MGLFGQRCDTSVVPGCGPHRQLGPAVGGDFRLNEFVCEILSSFLISI